MRWRRLLSLMRKEFIQTKRDRRMLAMMIVIPFLWLLIFGYAATFDVNHIPTAVAGSDNPLTKMLIGALVDSSYFDVVEGDFVTKADLEEVIRRGKADVGLLLPQHPGESAIIMLDGSNLFASQTAARQLSLISQSLASRAGISAQALFETEVLYNPNFRSANAMIPGLVGVVMVFVATLMTAVGVVRERERGTLEQLMVTPLSTGELMIGKIAPYVVISFVDLLIVVAAGVFIFKVPFAGNPLLLLGLSVVFLVACLAIGLLISTVSQTQQQAMQLSVFALVPQMLISGFIFPLSAIPWGVRWLAYGMPLTYFIPITKGIFVKNLGMGDLWRDTLILLGYAVVVIVVAAWRFRRRLA